MDQPSQIVVQAPDQDENMDPNKQESPNNIGVTVDVLDV